MPHRGRIGDLPPVPRIGLHREPDAEQLEAVLRLVEIEEQLGRELVEAVAAQVVRRQRMEQVAADAAEGDAVAPGDREIEHVLEAAEVEHRVVAAEARLAFGPRQVHVVQQRRLLVGRGIDRIDGAGAEPLLHQRLEVARRAGRRRRLAQGRAGRAAPGAARARAGRRTAPGGRCRRCARTRRRGPAHGRAGRGCAGRCPWRPQPTRRRRRLAAIAATATTITSSSTPIEVQARPEAPCAPPTVAAIATPTMPPVTMQRR